MAGRIAILGGGPNLAMQIARRFGREGWHLVTGALTPPRLEDGRA